MEMLKHRFQQLFVILGMTLLAVYILPFTARIAADLIWPWVSAFDPERVFLWISIHHIVMLALTVLVMKFVFKKNLSQWGFNLNHKSESLKSLGSFALVFLGYRLLQQLPDIMAGTVFPVGYPLTAKNMAGVLGFQFLLSGGAEEPLYRGLVMVVLAKYFKSVYRIGNIELPLTGIIATAMFMLAHIDFSFPPFELHYSLLQQFLSLVLGIYYAIIFHKTGSLLAPIIAHGYTNGILFVLLYSMTFLVG